MTPVGEAALASLQAAASAVYTGWLGAVATVLLPIGCWALASLLGPAIDYFNGD